MGMVERNDVSGALGIGIYCGDRSMCEIKRNVVSNTRADHASSDRSRLGYAVVSWFDSDAQLEANTFVGNLHGAGAFAGARIHRPR